MVKPRLKIVEPTPEVVVDPLEGYEPLLLSPQVLDLYWPQTAAVLKRCVEEAMHGEMTLDDIYTSLKLGRTYGIIVKNDDGELPDVALAVILEPTVYPQYTVLTIAALGGREFDLSMSKFWKHVCSWAYMNGARTLQASVSPAMTRILKRYGFEPVYTTVRMPLTEM